MVRVEVQDQRADLGALLDAVEAASPVQAVQVLASTLGVMVKASQVSFLIADFSGDALIRFGSPPPTADAASPPDPDPDRLNTVPLPGSPYEQALRLQQVHVVPDLDGGSARLYAPVTDRGDALGVLELTLPTTPDEAVLAFVASAAHALAYVIIANRRHTDLFERGQRDSAFTLAAEIQRRLLPAAYTCEAAEFTLAGWLEPANEVGGDTFDYSVERDTLHLSISDAKGHNVHAAQLATLAVAALRNSRRAHASVLTQAREANTAIAEHGRDEDFVSALLLRVNLATGAVTAVNAGHPPPYLVRDGAVSTVALAADLPFGVLREDDYQEQALTLRPGDRLVLVTDGILERNATALDVAVALAEMTRLHPREVVHTFARAVLDVTGGKLEDDATLLCLDWYGPLRGGNGRDASSGASQARASEPAD